MATTNYLTENSIKAVLAKIAQDIQAKVTSDNIDSLIADYLLSHSEDTDLITLIVGIINDNTNNVNLDTILSQYLSNYYTKNQVYTKSQVYTKDEIDTLLANHTSNQQPSNPSTVVVTGVILNHNTLSIVAGSTSQLTATITPSNATNKAITWSTSNSEVATVNDGLITAVAAGSATITVTTTDGSYTDTCVVTVTAQQVVSGTGTSDFISSSKLNLNGLDTTGIDGENESVYSNRILFLNDDFEGDSLDENLFSMSDGREPNYKVSTFKPANVTVHDSMMTLLGQKAESVDAVDGATRPFTGAEVITRLHFQNCLFEAKMRHPREYDWCTAFWTCGYNVTGFQNWSYCGEIDVFEDIHNEKKATFHYASNNSLSHQHSTTMTSTVLDNTVYNAYKASGGDGQWHVYGCELMQGKVRLYFDYKPFIEYATSEQSYYEGVNVFNHWQHFIWDSVAWATTATDMDYKLDIDWVRAWSLENEISSDLIPQSVQISYLGNEDRLATNGNIEVGTVAQLRPVYTPSTVPVVSNSNTTGHSTFTLSDNTKLSENGGAIIPIANGISSITFTDVFGTTATRQITGITEVLADGTDNLEDFDITTVVSKFGNLKYTNLNMDFSAGVYDTSDKSICYGLFKVDPSTEYQFSYSGSRSLTEAIRIVQFTADRKVSKKSISLTSASSFTTEATTEYVLVQGTLASSLILKDYKRVKQCFLNLNPSFTKVTT